MNSLNHCFIFASQKSGWRERVINLGISAQAIDFEFVFCKHARCSSTLEIVFSKTYTARTSEENFEGGVHQRSSAASSSVSEPSQPGVHQRLGKPESLDTCEKAPLQHSLGKDWCKGAHTHFKLS
jgi:hypothetical protein